MEGASCRTLLFSTVATVSRCDAFTFRRASSDCKSHFLIAYYRHLTDAVSYSFVVDSWSGEVDRVLILNVPAKKVMKGGERTTINITSQMICVFIRINRT